MDTANEIKKLRTNMGMNRKEFCDYYNIPYRTVTDWEAGKRKIMDKTKAKKSLPVRNYTGNAVRLSNADLTDILYAGSKDSPNYLVPGKDFRVTGYRDNIKTGTAKVTLQGLGEYSGTKALTFKIVKRKIDYKGKPGAHLP